MRISLFVFVTIMSIVVGSAVNADTNSEAKDLFYVGVEHFKAGEYEQAGAAFRKAYGIHPIWKLNYNIGQCEAARKRYGLALVSFENYLLEGGDDIPSERQEEVRKEIARLRDLTGELEVKGPEGAVVFVDGYVRGTLPLKGSLRVAAGDKTIRIVQGEDLLTEKEIRLATRGFKSIEVSDSDVLSIAVETENPKSTPQDAAPQEPTNYNNKLRKAGWVIAGAGAAVAIGGAIAGGVAVSKKGELDDSCPDGVCTDRKAEDIQNQGEKASLAADILIPSGCAMVAAGVVMVIVGHVKKEQNQGDGSARFGVTPMLHKGGMGFLLEGGF